MEITVLIKEIMPEYTGTSKSGINWTKNQFLGESQGLFKKDICFTMFGNNLLANFCVGEIVTVSCHIESKKFNNNWFTNVMVDEIKPCEDGVVNDYLPF